MPDSYRILLVGAGNMGANHARVIASHPRTELVGIVDPREDVARPFADRFGASWRPELGDLSGVDAVVLAAATGYAASWVFRRR